MKKVISLTLATLATAAVSFAANAHYPEDVPNHSVTSRIAMELDLFYVQFGNNGTDYLTLVPAVANPEVGTRFHNLDHEVQGGLRFSFAETSEKAFVLKGHKFDTQNREYYVHSGTAVATVAGSNMTFNTNLVAANSDFINSYVGLAETVVQLGAERKINLSDHANFNADWEAGIMYLKGQRNIVHAYDLNQAAVIVPANVVHERDTTAEVFDAYGIYFGVSSHASPFNASKCVTWFGHADFGLLWADNDFNYYHETVTGVPSATNLYARVGDTYYTTTESVLARVSLRTGIGFVNKISRCMKGGVSLFFDYTNTMNAFKNSGRYFTFNNFNTRGSHSIDLSHASVGLTFVLAGMDANISYEAK